MEKGEVVKELERITSQWEEQHDDDFLFLEYTVAKAALEFLKEKKDKKAALDIVNCGAKESRK